MNEFDTISIYITKQGEWDYGFPGSHDWKPVDLSSPKIARHYDHMFPKVPYVRPFKEKLAKEFVAKLNAEKAIEIKVSLDLVLDPNAREEHLL